MYKFLTVLCVLFFVSSPCFSRTFRRGDANDNRIVDLSDVIFINDYLWTNGPGPHCPDAADANDDGSIDISDPIFILDFLYHNGLTPPYPGPFEDGIDMTFDGLICWDFGPMNSFHRGDVDADNVINAFDLSVLSHWVTFHGNIGNCPDAMDVNDDEVVNSADVAYLTAFLFNNGSPPKFPFGACDIDPTDDGALWCYRNNCQ